MFQLIGYMEEFATCGNTLHVAKRSKRLQIAERLISEERAKVITYCPCTTNRAVQSENNKDNEKEDKPAY